MRETPTDKCIRELNELGFLTMATGGSGFIMSRYFRFRRPDGTDFCCTKTHQMRDEIKRYKSTNSIGT